MSKGRHAAEASSSFYRDLAMMVLGIALVGAAASIYPAFRAAALSPTAAIRSE